MASDLITGTRRTIYIILALAVVAVTAQKVPNEPEVITEPRPGEEFVLVSGVGGGAITASKPAPAPRGLAKTLTASFRTSHRIPEPNLRAAAHQRHPEIIEGPDPRSELERQDPDAFQTAHKVTRQARRFDAEAPEVHEAAAVDAEEALHREAPDDSEDDGVIPTVDSAGPTLLRLLGGPVPLAPRDLIADGPRLASVEIRPEGNSGLRGVKLPTDEQEKKMMARKANATTPVEPKEAEKTKAEIQAAKTQRKKVQKSTEELQVAASSDIRVEPEAERGVRKRQGEKRVLLGTSTVTEVSVQLSGEDRTQKIEELNKRTDLADLEPISTVSPSTDRPVQPATPTPNAAADLVSPSSSKNFEYVPVNLPETSGTKSRSGGKRRLADEDGVDFVDSPLSDKLLIPAGSSPSQQSSRVSVKKGPNGQEYEYEYVYYYYDEEDENNDNSTTQNNVFNDKAASRAPAVEVSSPQTPIQSTRPNYSTVPKFFVPATDASPAQIDVGQPAPVTEEPDIISAEEPATVPPFTANGRNRYTNIERNRPSPVPEITVPIATTPEPSSNEILPQGGTGRTRTRGRTLPGASAAVPAQVDIADAIPVPEERLPANTRFPPRGRGHQDVTTAVPFEGTVSTSQDTTIRPRVQSASPVRRPSLGLVDSSSFRTHGNDASPDQNLSVSPQPSPAFPSTPEDAFLPSVAPAPQRPSHTPPRSQPTFPNALPAGPHRFIGVAPNEEAPLPSRGQSHRFSSTASPPAPSSVATPAEVPRERHTRPHHIISTTTTIPSTTPPEVVTEAVPSTTTHHYRIRGHSRTTATSTTPATEEPAQVTQTTRPRGRGPQRGTVAKKPQTTRAEDEEEYVEEPPRRANIRRPTSATTSTTTTTTTTSAPPPTTAATQSTEDFVTTEQSISTEDATTAHTTPGDIGAFDLYAILQQARGDAAQNALDAAGTALPDDDDSFTTIAFTTQTSPATTTTTTTTTTTEAPTTTTTSTTTAAPPAAGPGRGRYRTRGPAKRPSLGTATEGPTVSASTSSSAPASRSPPHFGGARRGFRGQQSTTTTTETAPVDGTAPAEEKPKSRFSHTPSRANAKPFGRRGSLKTTAAPEEVAVEKDVAEVGAAPESGDASPATAAPSTRRTPPTVNRSRFRGTGPRIPSSSASTTAAPDQPKPSVADRFNLRRRPQVGRTATTTEAPAPVDSEGEETATRSTDDETSSTGSVSTAAAADATSAPVQSSAAPGKPGRARLSIGGGPRPLRPGPRVNIAHRPRPGHSAGTTAAAASPTPAVAEDSAVAGAAEVPTQPEAPADSQEVPAEASTASPDPLTRLRNRPRLRVHEKAPRPTPAAGSAVATARRQPSLLLRRGQSTAAPARVEEHSDSVGDAASPAEENVPATEEVAEKTSNSEEGASDPSTAAPAAAGSSAGTDAPSAPEHPRGLSSLLSRRRPGAIRKPGSLYTGKAAEAA